MLRSTLVVLVVGCGSGGHGGPDGGGDAIVDPACAGVVCDDPPAATCAAGNVLETFDLPGTCSGGTCSYHQDDRTCIGACSDARCFGGWVPLPQTNEPDPRFGHTAVWTGTAMIVWGGAISSTGSYGDGASYDPVTQTWEPISTTNAPSPRRDHSAVWTGTEMIVWGGTDITQGTGLADGGRYDPVTDTWTALSSTGAPQGRFGHSAVWTGTEMIVWGGGVASTSSLDDGARFDPATGTWTAISDTGAPEPRRDHSGVWTGSEMIVWGGSAIAAGGGLFDDTLAYDPVTDTWSPITTTAAPGDRFSHAAVWIGNEMIMFGGATSSTDTLDDGARFDPMTGAWSALPTVSEPTERRELTAVWTGSAVLVWGGSTIVDGGDVLADGAELQIFH